MVAFVRLSRFVLVVFSRFVASFSICGQGYSFVFLARYVKVRFVVLAFLTNQMFACIVDDRFYIFVVHICLTVLDRLQKDQNLGVWHHSSRCSHGSWHARSALGFYN